MRHPLTLSTFDPSILRAFRARAERLRDPLVQVWLLVATAFLFGMLSHYRADRRSGDEKIASFQSPARLLLGGARVTWSDDFAGGPSAGPSARPRLSLRPVSDERSKRGGAGPVVVSSSDRAVLPDWKSAAAEAGRLPWRHLDRKARTALNAVPRTVLPEVRFVTVRSGGSTGNLALVEHHRSRRDAAGADFVIGNGSRSADGEIEIGPGWDARASGADRGPVRICVVGAVEHPTSAQRQAVGELLNYLEARFGRLREDSSRLDGHFR